MKVSAVIVTRGGVDLKPVLEGIYADEYLIYHGAAGVFERYVAALEASHDLIYTQDDDCALDSRQVIEQHVPGFVTCNMPEWKRAEYPDGIALVGWGACFERPKTWLAFDRYLAKWPADPLFKRECDRVFTGLNPLRLVDVPFRHLPWAHGPDRLGAQEKHGAALTEIRRRIKVVRGAN